MRFIFGSVINALIWGVGMWIFYEYREWRFVLDAPFVIGAMIFGVLAQMFSLGIAKVMRGKGW
jgi:hypothetical protein